MQSKSIHNKIKNLYVAKIKTKKNIKIINFEKLMYKLIKNKPLKITCEFVQKKIFNNIKKNKIMIMFIIINNNKKIKFNNEKLILLFCLKIIIKIKNKKLIIIKKNSGANIKKWLYSKL